MKNAQKEQPQSGNTNDTAKKSEGKESTYLYFNKNDTTNNSRKWEPEGLPP